MCYPKVESKSIYMKRYETRGTNKEWIDRIDRNFEENLKSFEKRNVKRIILEKDETLEDKLKEIYDVI